MAYTLSGPLALGLLLTLAVSAQAQTVKRAVEVPASVQMPISPECRPAHQLAAAKPAFDSILKAFSTKRPLKILAIGSSSTVGIGATSAASTYPFRLEASLEAIFKDREVEVVTRGVSGEVAEGAAERMRYEVAEVEPDLVVWQVGTNDALARVDPDEFAETLRGTLDWLDEHDIDVVLIDPQYVEELAKDAYYVKIVDSIEEIAGQEHVPLVSRFDLMQDFAQKPATGFLSKDHLHLNDLGYRCMAEHVARVIVAGLGQSARPVAPALPAVQNAVAPKTP